MTSKEDARTIPFIPQRSERDCGPACLAMVLAYHGQTVELADVLTRVEVGPSGVDAATLLRAAAGYGLRGRGVSVPDLRDLDLVPRASILHWRSGHYVVFDRLDGGVAWIVDPCQGHRPLSPAELNGQFSGIALLFELAAPHAASGRRQG